VIENLSVDKPWLMLGDCLERMKEIPDGSVDLTVTSPPYDDLRTYNGYSFDFENVAHELHRVSKPGGVVVWVVGDATVKGSETGTSFRQALYFKDIGFNLHDTMIWHKTDCPPQTKVGRRYTGSFEYMFVFSKGRPEKFYPLMLPCKTAGRRKETTTQRKEDGSCRSDRIAARLGRAVLPEKPRHNVWSATKMGPGAVHPAQYPEHIALDHINSWSNPGDVVLDPFTGSGTTGKMAVLANRKFIGIEISDQYLDIARKRIDTAIAIASQPAPLGGLFDAQVAAE
jgi:DNA modification methylase